MTDYVYDLTLKTVSCFTCSIVIAIPSSYLQNRREDGEVFYCPNQHKLSFPKKDDKGETLKERTARLEEENETFKTRNIQLMAELDQTQAKLAEILPQPSLNAESDSDSHTEEKDNEH